MTGLAACRVRGGHERSGRLCVPVGVAAFTAVERDSAPHIAARGTFVTPLAAHVLVTPFEGITGSRMVEVRGIDLTPTRFIVTALAVLSQPALVGVLVARNTALRDLGGEVGSMAIGTRDTDMFADQRPAGGAVGRRHRLDVSPALGRVAIGAGRERGLALVGVTVAARAAVEAFHLVADLARGVGLVTTGARHVRVPILEGKRRPGVVEKARGRERGGVVAGLTFCAQLTAVVVLVAADTRGRRFQITRAILVAVRTSGRGMGPGQGKTCVLAVLEGRRRCPADQGIVAPLVIAVARFASPIGALHERRVVTLAGGERLGDLFMTRQATVSLDTFARGVALLTRRSVIEVSMPGGERSRSNPLSASTPDRERERNHE